MNMGVVFAVFWLLLALGIALPGLLLAWWLLLPRTAERAEQMLRVRPWRCFGSGLLALALIVPLLIGLMSAPSGVLKLLGWTTLFGLLTVISLGAAGMTGLMAERLSSVGGAASRAGALLRSAVALELAVIVPLVGWFVALPLLGCCALGAALHSLADRRSRRPAVPMAEVSHAPHTP